MFIRTRYSILCHQQMLATFDVFRITTAQISTRLVLQCNIGFDLKRCLSQKKCFDEHTQTHAQNVCNGFLGSMIPKATSVKLTQTRKHILSHICHWTFAFVSTRINGRHSDALLLIGWFSSQDFDVCRFVISSFCFQFRYFLFN